MHIGFWVLFAAAPLGAQTAPPTPPVILNPAPAQPAPATAPPAAGAEILDGTWKITALIEDGTQVPDDQIRWRYAYDGIFTIKGQTVTFRYPGTGIQRTVLFVRDTNANPKSIDLLGAEKTGGKGIYTATGDSLVLCIGEPGVNTRPTEFSAKKGSPYVLMMLRKVANPEVPKAPVTTVSNSNPPLPAPMPLVPAPGTQPAPVVTPAPPVPVVPGPVLVPVAVPQPVLVNADDQIRNILYGTWGHQDEDYNYTYTFNRDGTLSSLRTYKKQFGKIFHEDVRSSGTWKVQDGVILTTITTSTNRDLVNQISSYRIRTISPNELISVDQFGRLRREWRIQ